MTQSVAELARNVQLPQIHTKQIIDALKHDILLSLYRMPRDPGEPELTEFDLEMNQKVKALYKSYYKVDFNEEMHAKNKILPRFLMGPPGQGKTAAYIAAAKDVCADLGLVFVRNVTDNYVPKKNHFVMVVQECAGENSGITFGGIPKAEEVTMEDGSKVSVLKKAVNYRFTVFEKTAGGVLLFDDAANAPQVIQNVLLPVAQNNSFQGLKIHNALIGFTGNLGALDGTYTTDLSSALRTRVLPVFVTDTVEDFSQRAYAFYNDELGDLGIINYLKRNPNDFSVLPESNEKSGFACSRSWDNLIQSMRAAVQAHGGRGVGEMKALPEIYALAKSTVGPIIGTKLISYYNSLMRGADPLAHKFIYGDGADGRMNVEEYTKQFHEKYKNGSSSEDLGFGFQFATACGDYVVNHIAASVAANKNPKEALESGMKRFGTAVLLLNDSEFGYALEHMKTKLAIYLPDLSQASKDTRELTSQYREQIAFTINGLKDCDSNKRDVLIKVITDFDKVDNGGNVLNARKRRPMGT